MSSAPTVKELEARFYARLQADPAKLPTLLRHHRHDPRRGVKDLIRTYERLYQAWLQESQAYRNRFREEAALWAAGYRHLAGVDEVGRGPLAGPVVAAAVILPPHAELLGLNDSKQLTPAERRALVPRIRSEAVAWGIGVASVAEIDAVNIAQATFMAMRRALAVLAVTPDFVLVDGFAIPALNLPQKHLVKGDSLSNSIAAASVLAKEYRDALMAQYDAVYPGYGFGEHKGYATQAHKEALARLGPCAIHRQSFEWRAATG